MSDRTPIDLNLQQLRVFLVLGEELHFGRAAERLVLSQPYVSRTLAALERRIGGRLMERTSRRVSLTPLGEAFHTELSTAYHDLGRAFDHARAIASGLSSVLVVGCTTTSAGAALTALVSTFEKDHPDYRVRLRELPLNHPYAALRSGAVDVLVFWLPDEQEFDSGPVIDRQEMVLAMRSEHPLSHRETLSIEDVADYGIPAMAQVAGPASVQRKLWPTETPSGRPVPRYGPPSRTMSEVMDFLARSDAVKPTVLSVAQASAHRLDLVFRPIGDLSPLELGPIWQAGRAAEPIEALVSSARKVGSGSKAVPRPPARAELHFLRGDRWRDRVTANAGDRTTDRQLRGVPASLSTTGRTRSRLLR